MDRPDASGVTSASSSLSSAHDGHWLLESGLHTDRWFDLETLFCDACAIAPAIERLGTLLEAHRPTAVCGPLVGGAFLAQKLARRLRVPFFYAERSEAPAARAFSAAYRLPAAQRALARGQRIALVDDMISAGSSTRATLQSLVDDGAAVVAIGTLFLSGDVALRHFATVGIPLVAVERIPLTLWDPADCPLCRAGEPLQSRGG